jgi:tetratricopeptide (TPR) repeat protein
MSRTPLPPRNERGRSTVSVRSWRRLALVAALVSSGARLAAAAETPSAPKIRPDTDRAQALKQGDAYAHLIEAGLAVARGRAADAAREIDAAVALEPNSAELYAQGATLLAMLGRRADADRLARRALELAPGEIAAERVLADLAAARSFGPKADPQARSEAIRLYGLLAAEDPDAPDEIFSALARLKLASGDAAGAVEEARKLFDRRPGDENALRLLDQALVTAGRTKDALDASLAWMKAHPEDDDLLPLVVEMARDAGEWKLLESMCDTMLAADADNERARALRGEARLRQGRAKDALDDLEIARAASPRDPMVRLHVAAAYQALNRLADATQIAESLSAEYPDNTFVRVLLGETLARRGENEEARETYLAALKSLPVDEPEAAARRDEIRLRLVVLDLASKHADDAQVMLATLEAPEAPEALGVRARAALAAGDAKEAKRLARLLSPAAADDAALLEGEAELELGRRERANDRFAAVIAKAGPDARGDVAAIFHRHEQNADAEEQLRAWTAAAPKDAQARLALGAFLERLGRFREAETALRAAIELDPASAEAFNYLGYSLADRGERLDEAVALIKKALALDPWNGAYLDSLGWAYFKQGKLSEALVPLEAAVREFPKDPAVLEHLGDCYQSEGDAARARTLWQQALDAGPEDDKSKDGLMRKLGRAPAPAASAEAAASKPSS